MDGFTQHSSSSRRLSLRLGKLELAPMPRAGLVMSSRTPLISQPQSRMMNPGWLIMSSYDGFVLGDLRIMESLHQDTRNPVPSPMTPNHGILIHKREILCNA
jgi:hypothetical protein